ncbi:MULTISPECIES: ABC transporter ATPase [unclassified Tenacibaculum]|uniref:ABC transporter ATPase n=1 Tax=unclassified Tenacibaculum TaxID=2635139 RepID=UPI001F3DEC51|nr:MULTISPECIES: ABC transporter ATPase [unclassified Tenacibaculum]MCF2876161.1 ABC transporter ATPase [Tenacibaculum sp. Cn5-1]MCF2936236.1 ABC transporter ATPase [Tenacibaculum sp. Cn5-34]MCG7511579.1 ABC transporter ATPase [Tenacibaculum sp. Cn5-46]
MYTEYNNLPNDSRVWIYQADREFTVEEVEHICAKAILFIENWTRHGDDLKGSFTIKYNQFLVLAVDEGFNNVSGCSIDSSVRFVQELEKEMNVDLMNKMNVTFKVGENINIVKLPEFQQFAKEQKITSNTIVFNNMVNTKEDFETNWEVTADKSWHKRFLV